MITFLAVIHLIVALVLIFLVLIQDSKGGAMGGMLGGGGGNANSLLGATGATTFLVKVTRLAALIFAITCILLTIMSSNPTKSVVDGFVPAAASTETAAPADTAAPSPENAKTGDSSEQKK